MNVVNLEAIIVDSNGEPMKQNFKNLKLVDGKPKEKNEYREITLKDILKVSLLKSSERDLYRSERGRLKDKDVIARQMIWEKIRDVSEVSFTNKEKKIIKKLIHPHYEILVAGQALRLLN